MQTHVCGDAFDSLSIYAFTKKTVSFSQFDEAV